MSDVLDDVVVNVRNSGAGLGFGDDRYEIQTAIDTRRHVLFPAGTYRIMSGPLTFGNDRQRVTFLAGAVLLLNDKDDLVRITGKDQEFNGLRIDAVVRGGVAHEPILAIDGADRLLIRDFNVSCGPASVIVRVQDTRGLTLDSGRIHSSGGNEEGAIGVQLGEGAHEVRILATAIDNLDVSLEITATSRSVTVEACTFEATLTAAIRVSGVVEGLSLTGVHFEGRATGAVTGAWRFLHVLEGAAIRGGAIAGCEFGSMGLRRLGEPPRRALLVEGELEGVVVGGCYHGYGPGEAVWDITNTATVSQSCDVFTYWIDTTAATGAKADRLPFISDSTMAVTFTATAIQVDCQRIGFCGAEPVAHSGTYTVPATPSSGARDLSGDETQVLSQLIQDLAALGLVRCLVVP